jgi:membrane dipeptidase
MNRRHALHALAAATVGGPAILRGRYRLFAGLAADYSARAVRLVEESIVIDMLNQFRFADFAERPPKSERWLRIPGSFTPEDFEVYRTSGLRVVALGTGPPPMTNPTASYDASIRWFADWNGFLAGYDEWLLRIDDMKDFERARRSGRLGIILTFQNADHFRTIEDVDTFFGLGQRGAQLTYNFQNRIGSGFLEGSDGGLTVFGAAVIERMNTVGMAIDVSHCADHTTMDAITASKKPVLITHATARALAPGHLRCKTDEAIRAMAKTGGVMGVAFIRFMVRVAEPVTIEHVLDHFDYVKRLVGVDHVGIGGDLDVMGNPNPLNAPAAATPAAQPNFERYKLHTDTDGAITIKGLDHPKRVFDIAEGLVRRNWSDDDIRAALGGNWMRVLSQIWPA